MEDETPLAIRETIKEKKTCKCCGKELPITYFKRQAKGYRKICMACQRKNNGASEKFKEYSSRELMEELQARGFKGQLKHIQVETYNI